MLQTATLLVLSERTVESPRVGHVSAAAHDFSALHSGLRFEMTFEFSPQSSQTKAWKVRGWR